MRALLVAREVGPDAVPPKPAAPPRPAVRPRDWLDELLEEDPAPEPEPTPPSAPPPAAPTSTKAHKKRKQKKAKPGAARAAVDTRPPSPRQSLADAWGRVPYRLKWLTYHGSAAYLGWSVGLVGWSTYVTGWIAATSPVSGQAVFWYATAGATVLVYRRTRNWWLPVAWLAAVPVTSTVVGVLLYAPHP